MFQPGEIPIKECHDERPQVQLVDEQADSVDAITALGQEREPQPFFAFHCQPARLVSVVHNEGQHGQMC